MYLKNLLEELDVIDHQVDPKTAFNSIITDSRRAINGGLFFAINGYQLDGNTFIEQAIERGSVAVISEEPLGKHFPSDFVQVENVRVALAKISKLFYNSPDEHLNIIGITGTNGKTTVSLITQYLLGGSQNVGLLGTIRYDIGNRTLPSHRTTPDSVDCYNLFAEMEKAKCKEVVMEVSSHGIHQHRVDFVNMDTAAFLNLSRDHLRYHKTMEEYFAVKKLLFSSSLGFQLKNAIVNIDCNYGKKVLEDLSPNISKLTFGIEETADFMAKNIQLNPHGTEFTLVYPEGELGVSTNLLGRHNVKNILASMAIAYAYDRPMESAIKRLQSFPGVPGRMERIVAGQDFNIIVDYAHTNDAIDHACEMINEITRGRKIIVFGCGGERDRGKRELMMQAAIKGADHVIATEDNPRNEPQDTIFSDMKKGIQDEASERKVRFIADRRNALAQAFELAQSGDCVLIAGKGHETYQEEKGTMIPFDDRKVARELIENLYFKKRFSTDED